MASWIFPDHDDFDPDFIELLLGRKLSKQRAQILKALLKRPCWGYDLQKQTELSPKTIYKNLSLFRKAGLITMNVYADNPVGPPRKLFKLTMQGKDLVEKILLNFDADEASKLEEEE